MIPRPATLVSLLMGGTIVLAISVGTARPLLAQGATPGRSRVPTRNVSVLPAASSNPSDAQPQPAPPGTKTLTGPEARAAGVEANRPPLAQRIVRFIKGNGVWIVVALFCALAAALVWLFLGMRGKRVDTSLRSLGIEEDNGRDREPDRGSRRYSSTKIQKSDVSAGLRGSVTTTEVETDREYALVVDEEALKPPPIPEGSRASSGHGAQEADRIRGLVDQSKYVEAFREYAKQLSTNPKAAFPGEVEYALGEGLMRANELDKAVRVLERYVRARRGKGIKSLAFFNLGYIHFMKRSLQKSRRFFQLFVAAEKNPEYVERAKRILAKIENSGAAR